MFQKKKLEKKSNSSRPSEIPKLVKMQGGDAKNESNLPNNPPIKSSKNSVDICAKTRVSSTNENNYQQQFSKFEIEEIKPAFKEKYNYDEAQITNIKNGIANWAKSRGSSTKNNFQQLFSAIEEKYNGSVYRTNNSENDSENRIKTRCKSAKNSQHEFPKIEIEEKSDVEKKYKCDERCTNDSKSGIENRIRTRCKSAKSNFHRQFSNVDRKEKSAVEETYNYDEPHTHNSKEGIKNWSKNGNSTAKNKFQQEFSKIENKEKDNYDEFHNNNSKNENWIKTERPLAKSDLLSNESEPLNLSNGETFDEPLIDSGCASQASLQKIQNNLVDLFQIAKDILPEGTSFEDNGLEITERILRIFLDIIESNSQVTRLVQPIPENKKKSNELSEKEIIEEVKYAIFKDKQIEENINKFLAKPDKQPEASHEKSLSEATSMHSHLKVMGKTLEYVKNNMDGIRGEISNFQELCWGKINQKVSKTEFRAVNDNLKVKLHDLENRIYNDQKNLKQEVMKCREKILEADCSSSNVPVWPFFAFLGAYSLMQLGKKV